MKCGALAVSVYVFGFLCGILAGIFAETAAKPKIKHNVQVNGHRQPASSDLARYLSREYNSESGPSSTFAP